MKIRNGFVSNSSSSSFIIVGINSENKEIKEIFTDLYNKLRNREISIPIIEEVSGQEDYYRYIGIDLVKGAQTMTIPQMKELFVKELQEAGFTIPIESVGVFEECYYNG